MHIMNFLSEKCIGINSFGLWKKKKFSIQAGWRLNPTKLLKMVHFTKSLWVHVPFKKKS